VAWDRVLGSVVGKASLDTLFGYCMLPAKCKLCFCLFVFVWHGAETPDYVGSLSLNPLRTAVPYFVCYLLQLLINSVTVIFLTNYLQAY
jgi:hypothetical protein